MEEEEEAAVVGNEEERISVPRERKGRAAASGEAGFIYDDNVVGMEKRGEDEGIESKPGSDSDSLTMIRDDDNAATGADTFADTVTVVFGGKGLPLVGQCTNDDGMLAYILFCLFWFLCFFFLFSLICFNRCFNSFHSVSESDKESYSVSDSNSSSFRLKETILDIQHK